MAAAVGNQYAAKAKRWQKSLERALARAGDGDIDAGLNPIADKVVAAAIAGDRDAWREIGDRLDGKPAQSIVGDPENPLHMIAEIRRKVVEGGDA